MASLFPHGLNSGPMFGIVPPTQASATPAAPSGPQAPATTTPTSATTPADDAVTQRTTSVARSTATGSILGSADRLGGS